MKKLVIFFGEIDDWKRSVLFGTKARVYLDFFGELYKKDIQAYLCFGQNNFISTAQYRCKAFYNGSCIIQKDCIINPDFVFDRAGASHHPSVFSEKVFNNLLFKTFCRNKIQGYKVFPELHPKTFIVHDTNVFDTLKNNFEDSEKIVFKPIEGMKGKNVAIIDPKNLNAVHEYLKVMEGKSFLVREFLDTSVGIDGVVESTHDLRVVFIGQELIWSHVRTPKKDSLIANVAQGGSIRELSLDELPKDVLDICTNVSNKILEKFDKPFFSIDLGMTKDGPKIFEFNSQVGFPRPDMASKDKFIHLLVDRISREI